MVATMATVRMAMTFAPYHACQKPGSKQAKYVCVCLCDTGDAIIIHHIISPLNLTLNNIHASACLHVDVWDREGRDGSWCCSFFNMFLDILPAFSATRESQFVLLTDTSESWDATQSQSNQHRCTRTHNTHLMTLTEVTHLNLVIY